MTEGSELCASLSPNEGKGSLFHTLVLAPYRELLLMMRKSEPFVPFPPHVQNFPGMNITRATKAQGGFKLLRIG